MLREKFLKRKIQRLGEDDTAAALSASRLYQNGAVRQTAAPPQVFPAAAGGPMFGAPHFSHVAPGAAGLYAQDQVLQSDASPARKRHQHQTVSSLPSAANHVSAPPLELAPVDRHPSGFTSQSFCQQPIQYTPSTNGPPPMPTQMPKSEIQLVSLLACFLLNIAPSSKVRDRSIGQSTSSREDSQHAVYHTSSSSSSFPIDASAISRSLRLHFRTTISSSSISAIHLVNTKKVSEALKTLAQQTTSHQDATSPAQPPLLDIETVGLFPRVLSVNYHGLAEWLSAASAAAPPTVFDPQQQPQQHRQISSPFLHQHPQYHPAATHSAAAVPPPYAPTPPFMQHQDDFRPYKKQRTDSSLSQPSSIESLLSAPSARERELVMSSESLRQLLTAPTAKQTLTARVFQNVGGSRLREFCPHGTTVECCRAGGSFYPCAKVHFRRIILPHTDVSLGDCSYLDTCRHKETCKFVHYEVEICPSDVRSRAAVADAKTREMERPHDIGAVTAAPMEETAAQWIRCDLRAFDFTVLSSKVKVVMADPPWDIHMDLPYGTMTDNEMRGLRVDLIQDEGLLFLWVTGRAMELGRECMQIWGYKRVEEVIWVKTNQLQRIIRTGRTGHWINHSKEHCLVGIKGNPKINRNIDCDVVVAEVRETSRKPDEIYRIIERMIPGCLKVELFGRQHNVRKNWITLGNQLHGVELHDADLIARYTAVAPQLGLPPLQSSDSAAPALTPPSVPTPPPPADSVSPSDASSSAASVSLLPNPRRPPPSSLSLPPAREGAVPPSAPPAKAQQEEAVSDVLSTHCEGQQNDISTPADDGQQNDISTPAGDSQQNDISTPADDSQQNDISTPADDGQPNDISTPADEWNDASPNGPKLEGSLPASEMPRLIDANGSTSPSRQGLCMMSP